MIEDSEVFAASLPPTCTIHAATRSTSSTCPLRASTCWIELGNKSSFAIAEGWLATDCQSKGIVVVTTQSLHYGRLRRRCTSFLFFYAPFCNCDYKGSRSLCQLQSTVVGRLRTGREAAGLRSLLPTSICKELVQSWRRASSTKLRLQGELQEGGCERTLRRNGDEATPAENPCCLGGVADSGRGTGCACPGEEANKGGGFLSPASSNLETKHDQATAAAASISGYTFAGVCVARHCGRPMQPTWLSAASCGRPSRLTGLTSVASTASCALCQSGRPLQTTSMRRASWTGTSIFMAASATLHPTRAPASWQTRAMARSRGNAREASTPDVEHAARWSPYASRAPRQEQLREPSGRGWEGHAQAAQEQDAEV